MIPWSENVSIRSRCVMRIYDFDLDQRLTLSRTVLLPGETVEISGRIRNKTEIKGNSNEDNFEVEKFGTVYIVVTIASSHDHTKIVFNSDCDKYREGMRCVDIPPDGEKKFMTHWICPERIELGHYDLRIEVWSPPKLYGINAPHRFDESGWRGAFPIVGRGGPKRFFISYAHHSDEHKQWIRDFVDALKLHRISVVIDHIDLQLSQDIGRFMVDGIDACAGVVLVCSEALMQKVENEDRSSGVRSETILTRATFNQYPDKWIIPVIRNGRSSGRRIPTYLGNKFFLNMDVPDWDRGPLQQLLVLLREVEGRPSDVI